MVLIVDDDAQICQLLCELVVELGHIGLSASNGHAALELARAHRPTLILSDVMMPVLDGYGLVAALRMEPGLAEVKVVLMSAAFQQNRPMRSEIKANGYIAKPFELPEIEGLIERFAA
jgi:CheY-like chemotaxis protein